MSTRFWRLFTRLGAAISMMGTLGARTHHRVNDELQNEAMQHLLMKALRDWRKP